MRYKLRDNYTHNAEEALSAILKSRGVKELQTFLHPSPSCELNPYDLDNIDSAADCYLRHLRENHSILFVVDADCDGFTSSSILWLYTKHIFPNAKLEFTVHTHKQHGLDDKIDWIEDEARWDLVVVPDAGSYDVQEHLKLGQLGMDCIILDHHEQEYDKNGKPIISTIPNTIVVNLFVVRA